jgi:hypothetical protein
MQKFRKATSFKILSLTRGFLFLTLLLPFFNSFSAFGANELGVRVSVLAESKSNNSQLYTDNSKLWFISTKNQLLKRTIWIQDTVGSDQVINLSIGGAKNIEGKLKFDPVNKSEISDWVTFSENNFLLKARNQKKIVVSIKPSADLIDFQQDAYLMVTASKSKGSTQSSSNKKAPIKVVIPVNFAYAVPLFVGIGNIENLVSFKITDLNGYLDGKGKYLEVSIDNDGLSLIEPTGTVQLKLADFESDRIGPFKLETVQFRPKSKGVMIARVPDSVVPGKYESLVEVQFGSFADAKLITKYLEFKPKSNFSFFNISLILLGVIIILVSAYYGQKNNSLKIKYQHLKPNPLNNFRKYVLLVFEIWLIVFNSIRKKFKLRKNNNKTSNSEISDLEIEKWLAEILGDKSTAKKSTAKKSTAKKSTAKKSTAKKSTAKKSTAKKSTAKKS